MRPVWRVSLEQSFQPGGGQFRFDAGRYAHGHLQVGVRPQHVAGLLERWHPARAGDRQGRTPVLRQQGLHQVGALRLDSFEEREIVDERLAEHVAYPLGINAQLVADVDVQPIRPECTGVLVLQTGQQLASDPER